MTCKRPGRRKSFHKSQRLRFGFCKSFLAALGEGDSARSYRLSKAVPPSPGPPCDLALPVIAKGTG